ncbi:MAG: hypothetical protein OQL28_00565 [Sedimenticola sp.]|nr:hypothetical protein [Sedimenticola sp.]
MSASDDEFMALFRGSFVSALRWPQLDALWAVLRKQNDGGWFVYAVGEAPPEAPLAVSDLERFVSEIDAFLRREHDEDYCGIVYADSLSCPSMIKIYDPHNLGVSCGFSNNPPLPGWVVSRLRPNDLPSTRVLPNNRRRWWRRLFGGNLV